MRTTMPEKNFYNRIREDALSLVKQYQTRDPKKILEERGVHLRPFLGETQLLGMYRILLQDRFVFYNAYLDERMLKMVLAHELGHDFYHREYGRRPEGLVEFTLNHLTDDLELEANLFAAHLLLDEEEIDRLAKEGYSYTEMAALLEVDTNLLLFKLNEMQRMGYALHLEEHPKRDFFSDLDGKDEDNWDSLYKD